MALIRDCYKTTDNEYRTRIHELTTFGTDNLSWKNFEGSEDKEKALAVIDDIPKIEEILEKYGELYGQLTEMWWAGIGWTILLKGRTRRFLEVCYSDGRFKIRCLKGDLIHIEKYEYSPPSRRNNFMHKSDEIFTLCDYAGWIQLDKLEDFLQRFVGIL